MKSYYSFSRLVLYSSLFMMACNKSSKESSAATKPTLVFSKSVFKIGEPVMVTTKDQAAGATVQWSAVSSAGIWTTSTGDTATFLFTHSGNYQVQASYNPVAGTSAADSTHSIVTINDSIYTDPSIAYCNTIASKPISAGDQISITPVIFSDSAGLVLLVHTLKAYDYAPVLYFTGSFSGAGGKYECDFTSITEYPCNGYDLVAPATANVFFDTKTYGNGTYTLVCTLNGTTYTGSLTLSSTACTFTWNYTSGVTISPLQLQKL